MKLFKYLQCNHECLNVLSLAIPGYKVVAIYFRNKKIHLHCTLGNDLWRNRKTIQYLHAHAMPLESVYTDRWKGLNSWPTRVPCLSHALCPCTHEQHHQKDKNQTSEPVQRCVERSSREWQYSTQNKTHLRVVREIELRNNL